MPRSKNTSRSARDKRIAKYVEINDGWENLLSGFGTSRDKTTHNTVARHRLLHERVLTDMFLGDGLGKAIITTLGDDMTRAGFTVKGDEENQIVDYLEGIGFPAALQEAVYWARNFGGSLMVLDINDGRDLEEEAGDGEVKGFEVYDKTMVDMMPDDMEEDPDNPLRYAPELFTVNPVGQQGTGQFKVHASRCLWFNGALFPKNSYSSSEPKDLFFGVSELQAIFDDIATAGVSHQALATILQEYSIAKLKVANMGEILMENNASEFYQRMEIVSMQKSAIHAVILGADEEFGRDTISLSGIGDAMGWIYTRVCATAKIPETKLLGKQASGLSNSDDVSLQNYYTHASSERKLKTTAPISKICAIVNKTLKIPDVDERPRIDFNPIWEPSADKMASSFLTWMQGCEIAIRNGVLDPSEVRNSTFGTGRITFQIQLDESISAEDLEADAEENARATAAAEAQQGQQPPAEGDADA